MGSRGLQIAAALVLALTACRDRPSADTEAEPTDAPLALRVPAVVPAQRDMAAHVGAEACAECHADAYAAWKNTPHARAMTKPSSSTIRAPFDGRAVDTPDGPARAMRDGEAFWIELGGRRYDVDLVIGAGRQHQVYLTRDDAGYYALAPLIGITWQSGFVPTALYQPDPRARDLVAAGCLDCHLSQASYRPDEGGVQVDWVDLSINCEACHGPGRDHIAARRAGRDDDYPSLRSLSQEEDARICGACHAARLPIVYPQNDRAVAYLATQTLAHGFFRPDGTQKHTSYQYTGHVLSECYREGLMTCVHCHDAHSQRARSVTGHSAEGAHSNRQCTDCHRDRIEPAAARAHSHHGDDVRCVDCHMAYSWIGDSPDRAQRTSDHSISIPRPRETLEVGTPNACTTCHDDRDAAWALAALEAWGATRALEARPWVLAIDRARRGEPDATEALLPLLDDTGTTGYLRLSALELLLRQPPSDAVVDAVSPLADHPAPQTRAYALAALIRHDPDGAADYFARGWRDADPFVRTEMFFVAPPALLERAHLARFAQDMLDYGQHMPVSILASVAERLVQRDQREAAAALLDLARRAASPAQRDLERLDRIVPRRYGEP